MDLQKASKGDLLGVSAAQWQSALSQAEPDPSVGIRHAVVAGDAQRRVHVAAIPVQVGCHFHAHGDEDYAVVQGSGVLHWGRVDPELLGQGDEGKAVQWQKPEPVQAGDSFVVPEGFAHQLRRRGDGDLTILFACPDSHLDDTVDRTMLADAPQDAQ